MPAKPFPLLLVALLAVVAVTLILRRTEPTPNPDCASPSPLAQKSNAPPTPEPVVAPTVAEPVAEVPAGEPPTATEIMLDMPPRWDGIPDVEIAREIAALEGMELDEALDVLWDQKETACDFASRDRVAEVVRTLPATGTNCVTPEEQAALREWLTDFLMANGGTELPDYMAKLRSRGYDKDEEGLRKIRHDLADQYGIPEERLPEDKWKLMELYAAHECKRPWQGLVADGSMIQFSAITDATELQAAGQELGDLHCSITAMGSWLARPENLHHARQEQGVVILAEAMLLIAFDESCNKVVRPYIVRSFYSESKKQWIIDGITFFPNSSESISTYPLF